MPSIDGVFFTDEPPEFEYRDGLFHITQAIGNCRFERVMRPHVFMLTLRRAAEAASKHYGTAEVIDFPKKANGTH